MSARNDKYRAKYLETVAPHVEGDPVAVGLFTRAGSMGTAALSQVSGLAFTLANRSGKKKGGGLPMNVVMALTAEKVYVFPYKPKGTGLKVKDPVVVWDRSAVTVTVEKSGAVANSLRFDLADGESIKLDSTKMPGSKEDFNAPFIETLNA